MKFLKEHAKLMAIVVIFVLAVIILFSIYNSIFLNNTSKYGDRLKGIDEVNVTNHIEKLRKIEKEIKENIKTLDITKSVEIEESGKIINVIALVNDDIEVNKSKEIGNKVIEKLSDKQKKYFDVQIFIKKSSKDEKFPIIGYKHHNKDNITWTKDR